MNTDDIKKLLTQARFRRMTLEGFTTRELMRETGLKMGAASNLIRSEMDAGRIAFCGAKASTTRDGRPCKSPAYKIVKP